MVNNRNGPLDYGKDFNIPCSLSVFDKDTIPLAGRTISLDKHSCKGHKNSEINPNKFKWL